MVMTPEQIRAIGELPDPYADDYDHILAPIEDDGDAPMYQPGERAGPDPASYAPRMAPVPRKEAPRHEEAFSQLDAVIQAQADLADDRFAYLYAQYGGADPSWPHARKAMLASIGNRIRETASEKMTEKAIDDAAHADPEYKAYLNGVIAERAEFIVRHYQVLQAGHRITAMTSGRYA